MAKLRFFPLFIFLCASAAAQNVKDSCIKVPLVGLHLSAQLPGGDLVDRFGINGNVGLPFYYKTKKNILIGGEFNYFFGHKLKVDIFANLRTPEGSITNSDGNPGNVRIQERGWSITACIGKIFAAGPNKNSGVIILAGAGYMQHKINISDLGRNLAQINGEYKKGYDKLTGGPMLSQFIGYFYLSNNRLANFIAGFEFFEGFTRGLRGYQFDTMSSDDKRRIDILSGARIGWILPIYKRTPKDFYSN
ncbi:MAG: hypothetical protein ACJ76F_11655 [Bacteroidia bacterium]